MGAHGVGKERLACRGRSSATSRIELVCLPHLGRRKFDKRTATLSDGSLGNTIRKRGRRFKVSTAADPVGTLEIALNHTARLLDRDPKLAAEQANEILKVAPRHPAAMLMLGVAQRRGGRSEAALSTLEAVVNAQPNWAAAQYELGLALIDM